MRYATPFKCLHTYLRIFGRRPLCAACMHNWRSRFQQLLALITKATVDFKRLYGNYGDGVELKRERYTAHFVFVVKDRVPNAVISVNPLGLTITYFREEQAFQ